MLLAAAPGGVTTNLFTYLAKSNVPLSIVLTVIAPILVMATMPLWVWITVRLFEDTPGTSASSPFRRVGPSARSSRRRRRTSPPGSRRSSPSSVSSCWWACSPS
ncbi:hypothetical protein [Corynebacterium sp.]|uniref:hypothetical protein n=1 Tax=Corynebacterium sp. TaxID=1720 RepID=UPI00345D6ED7